MNFSFDINLTDEQVKKLSAQLNPVPMFPTHIWYGLHDGEYCLTNWGSKYKNCWLLFPKDMRWTTSIPDELIKDQPEIIDIIIGNYKKFNR